MGKRRKGRSWVVYNFNQPSRKYGVSGDQPLKNDRYHVFRWLLDNVASQNSGKYLEERLSRGDYHWYERDRESRDQRYFLVRVRGNYIIVEERRWVIDGEGINTFMACLTGMEKDSVLERKIIVRHPINQWDTFREAYAKAAPSLNVWLD